MERHTVAGIRWFMKAGIDDLAKYRVVELLMRSPDISGSVDFFSDALGLKPRALVAQLLEELTQRGILTRQVVADSATPIYAMGGDGWMRRRLVRLYWLAADARIHADLLRQLARRSLRKVTALARRHQLTEYDDAVILPGSCGAAPDSVPPARAVDLKERRNGLGVSHGAGAQHLH